MIKLENKGITVSGIEVSYSSMLGEIAKAMPQGQAGYDIGSYDMRLKILAGLDKAGKTIEIEKDHYDFLLKNLPNWTPRMLDEGINSFVKDFRKAELE